MGADVNEERRKNNELIEKDKEKKKAKLKKRKAKIVLRLITPQKVSQANVKQDATFAEVQESIAKKTKIPVEEQVLQLKLPEGLEELKGDPEDPIEDLGVTTGSEIEVSRKATKKEL